MDGLSDETRAELSALLRTMSITQVKFVHTRMNTQYDREAAELVGVSKETVSKWENKKDIDRAVKLVMCDGVMLAAELLRRQAADAALALGKDLTGPFGKDRIAAAIAILDRTGLAVTQKLDLNVAGAVTLERMHEAYKQVEEHPEDADPYA